jgi:transposase InsO family protein
VVLVFGCFRLLVTDQGTEFCNQLLDEVCRLLGIARHTTSADDTHGVAIDERTHLELLNAIWAVSAGSD